MAEKFVFVIDRGWMTPGARTTIPGSWDAPAEVTLDETAGLLRWSGKLRRVQPTRQLLPEFLKIWRTDNAAIHRFAQHWGPLWLCDEHQRPIMHRWMDPGDLARGLAGNEVPSRCALRRLDDEWYAEPLDAWRRLSVQAWLILRAGSLARRDELPFKTYEQLLADMLDLPKNTPGERIRAAFLRRLLETEKTWASLAWFRDLIELGITGDLPEALADSMVGRVRDTIGTKEQFAKTLQHPDALAEKVNQWIEDGGGFRQKAVWHDGWPQWQREVPSLYAAIGVGLWNVIGDMTTGPRCKNCGQVFQPSKSTQRYCAACGKRARDRDSKRRSRAKRSAPAESI